MSSALGGSTGCADTGAQNRTRARPIQALRIPNYPLTKMKRVPPSGPTAWRSNAREGRGGGRWRHAAENEHREIVGETLVPAVTLDGREHRPAQLGCSRGAVRAGMQGERALEAGLVEGRPVGTLGL